MKDRKREKCHMSFIPISRRYDDADADTLSVELQ